MGTWGLAIQRVWGYDQNHSRKWKQKGIDSLIENLEIRCDS